MFRRTSLFVLLLSGCDKSTVLVPPDEDPTIDDSDGTPTDPIDVPTDPAVQIARTRSGAFAVSIDGRASWVADPDNGELVYLDQPTGTERRIPLGSEPTRVVRYQDNLWVTLRGDGDLVHLRLNPGRAEEIGRVHLGGEPFDVVVSEDGARVYVSVSMAGEVVGLDAQTLTPFGRWATPPEPRWLAVRNGPDGDDLWVSGIRGNQVYRVQPDLGSVTPYALPSVRRFVDPRCVDRRFSARPSGEIAFDAATGLVYFNAFFADTMVTKPNNEDLVLEPGDGGDDEPQCGQNDPAEAPPVPGEGAGGGGVYTGLPSFAGITADSTISTKRFAPVLIELDPTTGTLSPHLVTWFTFGNTLLNEDALVTRGVPTGLEVISGEAGPTVLVSLESTSAVVSLLPRLAGPPDGAGAFVSARRASTAVPPGPSSLRAVGEGATGLRLYSWLDRTISEWSTADLHPETNPLDVDATSLVSLPESSLDLEILQGRELFFRADLPQMSFPGSGTSCSSCHADGRTDGFTYIFSDFPRQVPSLAGPVKDTEPVTWIGDVPTVEAEAIATVEIRMAGGGISEREAEAIAAFVHNQRRVILPEPTAEQAAAIERGRAIFNRPDVACATCHQGELGTSPQIVPLFGLPEVSIPPLYGVAATAPYLHDGTAATLRDVLNRSRLGMMGDASALSAEQLDDLEAYLHSL